MLIYSQNTYIGQSKDSCLGRSEQDIVRFHHATEHDVQFRIYDLFISRIFYLLFLEANRKWNCGYCNPTLFWMQHNLESTLLGEIPIISDMQMTWPLWQKAKVKVKSLSCVWLFVKPWTVACQAPLSMGFSRQEYWSGLSFPSPGDRPNPGIELGSPTLQADSSIWARREFWLKIQHSEN